MFKNFFKKASHIIPVKRPVDKPKAVDATEDIPKGCKRYSFMNEDDVIEFTCIARNRKNADRKFQNFKNNT